MLTLLILFTSCGILMMALSIPLILQKIGPNPIYGFRVKQTLENPEIWYLANTYSAVRLLILGGVITTTAILFYCLPGMTLLMYSIMIGVIAGIGLTIVVVQSFIYLHKIQTKHRKVDLPTIG